MLLILLSMFRAICHTENKNHKQSNVKLPSEVALYMYQRGAYRYFQSSDVVEDLDFRYVVGVDAAL